jgi:isopenicillin-N epimerase
MPFGRSMLSHWLLDPEQTYLNHGTVGVTPRRVLEKQQALRDEIERQPSRFLLRELAGEMPAPWRERSRLREAMESVAPFLGSRPEDMVFVPNVTVGVNAVLGSIPLAPGDEILITDLAYGAVRTTARVVCERSGATLKTVAIAYPVRDSGDVVESVVNAITPATTLAIVDHVTAQTALVLPVASIARECRARGVAVLVDGAHAPGSRHVDIRALGVDWYSANLHKWMLTPRGCGILWAAPERQSVLHSPIVSWGRDRGFLHEFEHTPTFDPTSFLAAPEAIALLQEWGFDACVAYMHGLAWDAGLALTERWHTTLDTPREMTGAMVTVPLPPGAGATEDDATRLRLELLVEDGIEVALHAYGGRLWARVSTQIYNDTADVMWLGEAVARRTADL